MYAYLTMISGRQAGSCFPLDPSGENPIGRGRDCAIRLDDPLCSRVHATVVRQEGTWHVRDASSRNGTLVNGQPVDQSPLEDGHTLKLGGTEFCFHLSAEPPTATADVELGLTETIVQDIPVDELHWDEPSASALASLDRIDELLLLYQLAIRLLGCEDPDTIVRVALELLQARTKAAIVGFLWVSDEGELKPKIVLPEEARERVNLSRLLTELVSRQGHAVWIARQAAAGETSDLEHFADGICAPLVRRTNGPGGNETLGAIHVYLQQGRFRQSDFELIISVANIVAVALVRARSHLSLQTDFRRLVETTPGYDELVGKSRPMRELKSKIQRVAKAAGCVLIRGESGTGKELVARAIHQSSARADRPLLTVNCAAIPGELIESQLFGHRAGAFTGADRDHVGFFMQADLGTLFLDEVGEMSPAGQAKLLRVLEGHPFLPVGADREVSADVRVIAATNQDLQAYVRQKKFREDLYYRLGVFELEVPPLRDRDGDVGVLIDYFLRHFCVQRGRPGMRLAARAHDALMAYAWPGNVRQLRNVLDSAVVLAEADVIDVSDLSIRAPEQGTLPSLRIEVWEKKLIEEALARCDGSMPAAAKLLGIGRATLYRKIDQYGIVR